MGLSEEALKHKKEYTAEYIKQNYKRVPLNLSPAKYEELKTASLNAGESVNGYIKKAIDLRLQSGK